MDIITLRNVRRIGALMTLAALVLAGCGAPATESGIAATAESPEAGQPTDEAGVPTEGPPVTPLLAAPGLGTVTLTTPQTGGGVKPLLAWEPVDGAALYTVIVFAPDGGAYWAWEGESTSVTLGGGAPSSPPAGDRAGPVLQAGMAWSVIARDADGAIIAASGRQLIGP